MKQLLVTAILVLTALGAGSHSWTAQRANSRLGFRITQLMVSRVEGSFSSFTATLRSGSADFSDAVFELSADVASINTGNRKRDAHLQAGDFFDVPNYPTLTFRSTGFKKTSDRNYTLTGNLTMHGITKPVTLQAVLVGQGMRPDAGKNMVGFKVTGTLKRLDYGIGKGSGTATMSNEVEIIATGEFVQN